MIKCEKGMPAISRMAQLSVAMSLISEGVHLPECMSASANYQQASANHYFWSLDFQIRKTWELLIVVSIRLIEVRCIKFLI